MPLHAAASLQSGWASLQPDSDIVVSAAYDCTVRLWKANA
jgi:WD40 repeat protein